MRRWPVRRAALLIAGALMAAAPVEPLVGRWLLKTQQISGQETALRPLILEIRPVGELLQFEYSVPTKAAKAVSLTFVARLDGSASEVKDAQGRKVGTAKVLRGSALEYSLILEGPNRPTASGKLKLSADRGTLVCDSDSAAPGGARTHTVQVFARQ
jgi:hypothetical protein